MFEFGNKKRVIDLTKRYQEQQEDLGDGKNSQTVESHESSSQGSNSDLGRVEFNGSGESDKRKKLAKRLIDMSKRIDDLSSQVYHLQQRIELLERKLDVNKF